MRVRRREDGAEMKALALVSLAVFIGAAGCAGDDPAPGVTGAASAAGADGGMAGAAGGASEVDGGGGGAGGTGGATSLPVCALQVTSFYGCYPGPHADDCNPDPVTAICTFAFPAIGCFTGQAFQENCIATVVSPALDTGIPGTSIPAHTDTVTCLSHSLLHCPADTQ